MRTNVVAIASVGAKTAGEQALAAGADDRSAMLAVMRDARVNWLSPTAEEAFAASLDAITKLWPNYRERVLAEAKAIGDRNRVVGAMLGGVPVDLDAALESVAPFPDDALGLLALWAEAELDAPAHVKRGD